MLMIGGGGEARPGKNSCSGALHVYVADVDALYDRALQAGRSRFILNGPTPTENALPRFAM